MPDQIPTCRIVDDFMLPDPRVARPLRRIGLRLGLFSPPFGEAMTEAPEAIDLPGAEGDRRKPVEIFVGTHPSMVRATRVLVRSLLAVRDPARRYRVRLLSNLKGVGREGWATGWDGYAAEAARLDGGRALYCDATFLFTADPAARFDRARGFVDLTRRPWAGVAPVRGHPWSIPRGAAPAANEGAAAARWRAVEALADGEGFLLFTRARPTREFGVLIGLYQRMHEENFFPGGRLKHHLDRVLEMAAKTGARAILDYGSGKAEGYDRIPGEPANSPWRALPGAPRIRVRCYDPGVPEFATLPDEPCDGVISTDVVEHLAPFDAPWVLRDMFDRARKFVFVVAACFPAIKTLPDGRNAHTTEQPPRWWRDEMAAAALGRPDVAWRMGCDLKGLLGKHTEILDGARAA